MIKQVPRKILTACSTFCHQSFTSRPHRSTKRHLKLAQIQGFADDEIKTSNMISFLSKRVEKMMENVVEKAENDENKRHSDLSKLQTRN